MYSAQPWFDQASDLDGMIFRNVCVTRAKERIARQMAEQKNDRVHPESVVLDIGQDIGALIIYTEAVLRGN